MKYLQLFENHDNYYTSSDAETFSIKSIGFLDRELYRIEKILIQSNPSKIEKIKYDLRSLDDNYDFFKDGLPIQKNSESGVYQINVIYNPNKWISIRKIKDEYYPVKFYGRGHERGIREYFYKCDQIDGLLKFLKDKI